MFEMWRRSRPKGQNNLTQGLPPSPLSFPRQGNPRRYSVPKETTLFRLLSHVDSRALEQALLDWLQQVLGPVARQDDQVSIDGKELLSSQGVQIVSAQGEVIQRYELNRSRPEARCRNQHQATLQGFCDFMSLKNHPKAFALVMAAAPSWAPP